MSWFAVVRVLVWVPLAATLVLAMSCSVPPERTPEDTAVPVLSPTLSPPVTVLPSMPAVEPTPADSALSRLSGFSDRLVAELPGDLSASLPEGLADSDAGFKWTW